MAKETITRIPRDTFPELLPVLVEKYADAMEHSPPWSTDGLGISREGTAATFSREWEAGEQTLTAEIDGQLVGATMYQILSLEELAANDNFTSGREALVTYLSERSRETGITTFVYIPRTFVVPRYQGMHIATTLRKKMLQTVAEDNPKGAIVITTHRSDNQFIVKSSQHLGFEETGIREYSEEDPTLFQQYWIKVVGPAKPI